MSTSGRFEKGRIPWNKGKRGYMGANRTSFTRTSLPKQTKIGSPKDSGRNGGIVCTIDERTPQKDGRTGKIYMHHKRTTYARFVMGDIPKGYIVYHKDGDYRNNNLDNLELITRGELLRRNRYGV